MCIFAIYFIICFIALLVRGHYRVPSSCINHEIIDKEENTVKSIIADRFECKCHYTNFLWNKLLIDYSSMNATSRMTGQQHFEPMALVSIVVFHVK
jgi:hypothetical protein